MEDETRQNGYASTEDEKREDTAGQPLAQDEPAASRGEEGEPKATEEGAVASASELAETRRQLREAREQIVRLMADFENARRRAAERQLSLREEVVAETVGAFLPIKDDLERALRAEDGPGLRQGVRMVLEAFGTVFGRLGVKAVPADGERFDPRKHQALAREAREGAEEGKVIEVFQEGYTLGERLIRPALVKVASGEAGDS